MDKQPAKNSKRAAPRPQSRRSLAAAKAPKPASAAAVPAKAKAAVKAAQTGKAAGAKAMAAVKRPAKSAPAPAQAAGAKAKPALPLKPAQPRTAAPAALPAKARAAVPAERQSSAAQPLSFRAELLSLLPSLRAFAVSLSGRADYADDLLQDTIMRAWAKQESYQPGTNMKAWLFTILRNEFYSQMRRRGREVQDVDGYFANNLAVHPAQYGALDLQDFKIALDKLPPDQREAIILIGASGFSYEEAAVICNCALGTVKSRVSRARARLQALLGIEGEGDYGPDASSAGATLRSYQS